MIDRREFLNSSVMGPSGAYLAHCTRLAAAEKSGSKKQDVEPKRGLQVMLDLVSFAGKQRPCTHGIAF